MNTYKVRVREDNETQYNVTVYADSVSINVDTGCLTFYAKQKETNIFGGLANSTVAVFPYFVYMKQIVSEEP